MPRKPRIHFPGALYHVMLRGNAGQDIFQDEKDRCRFYLFLQEGLERYDHRLLAFCLMTNHIHLAIQVGSVPLSRIMQNLSFRYTRWVNWRQKRTGHLFQGRYKAILIDSDAYVLELVAYLHLNPVRSGMTFSPGDYPWSSHQAYLGRETIPWLCTDYVLYQLSPKATHARRRFAEFVAERIGEGHREEFHGKDSTDSRLLGEDSFVEEVLDKAGVAPLVKPGVDEVLVQVCRIYDLEIATLGSPSQERRLSEARSLAAWAVQHLTDARLRELAARVNRDASSLSSAIRRLELRFLGDAGCREKKARLKRALNLAILQA